MTNTASSSDKQPHDSSQLITFTIFPDRLARSKEIKSLSIDDLATLLWQTRARSKKKLQLLKLATFGDVVSRKGCLRTNVNMGDIYGVEVEHDAGAITFEAATTILEREGLSAIIYTTPSHEPVLRERWRILLPLSKAYAKDQRAKFVSWVNGLFKGELANESFTLSQPFYFGGVRKDYEVFVIDGTPLDQHWHLADGAMGPRELESAALGYTEHNRKGGNSIEDLQRLLDQVRATGDYWHNSMVTVTASLAAKGWDETDIARFCADYCDDGVDDPDLWELIESAKAKFGFQPIPRILPLALQILARKMKPRDWDYTQKGQIKISMPNAKRAVALLGYTFSHDVFHNRLFIGHEDQPGHGSELTDERLRALRDEVYREFRLDFFEQNVRDAAVIMAEHNRFDPIVDMLAEAQANWDGKARLDRMAADYLNCEDTELNSRCVRKVMIAAVARARVPGCKFDTMPVFESKEGWNKSASWRVLAGDENFSDANLVGKETREVIEGLAGVWINEYAELAGLAKRDVDMVTAFLSRQEDRARPAYGRMLVSRPRRSVTVGTTNADIYLPKQTGNRRIWPIRVLASIDLGRLRADRLQLWGEAGTYQAKGESLVLDPELWAAAGVEQELRRVPDQWEEVLRVISHALIHDEGDTEFVFTVDLFKHVLREHGGATAFNAMRRLAVVMGRLGWSQGRKYEGNVQLRGYRRVKVKTAKT